MLKILNGLPLIGDYVVKPILDTVHFVVDTAQFLVGI